MILYFTGTGNSKYVAKRIEQGTGETALNLFDRIKCHNYEEMHSDTPWVIVTPTYAWRIPRILENWLKKVKLSGSSDIYFVMTCGENIGNAGQYLKVLCDKIDMHYLGCYEIVMPENYIALFRTPGKEEALKIIEKAETDIDKALRFVKSGNAFPEPKTAFKDKLSSGIVNDIFYPMFVHAKKFSVTDKCISCGLCEKVCPLSNVKLVNGRPVWGKDCTHCMACICRCPKEAVEYGRHSKGLPRYTCPK